MAPRTLASLSAALCSAQTIADALTALSQAVAESDRGASVALYDCDPQRALLCRCTLVRDGAVTVTSLDVSLDYLPSQVRQTLQSGAQFADMGAQAEDYMKLLQFPRSAEGGAFLLRGCGIDGELMAVLALHEPKRVFGGRLSEKLT